MASRQKKRHSTLTTLCVSLALFATGCATLPGTETTNPGFSAAEYETTAREKTLEGDYLAALTYWKLVKTIKPLDPEANHQVRTLQAFIERRVDYMLSEADFFAQQKQIRRAETLYLKTLALDPTNKQALSQLRKYDQNRVTSIQAEKTDRLQTQLSSRDYTADKNAQHDYYFDLAKAALEAGDWQRSIAEINRFMQKESSKDAQQLLATAEFNYALSWEQKGDYEKAALHADRALVATPERIEIRNYNDRLKQRAGEFFYNKGIKIYRTDIGQAIEWWEKAIRMDPMHSRAKLRLKKARAMQSTLNKIR